MTQTQWILKELTSRFEISKETLASKLGVSTRTIARWLDNETKPTYAERKLLNQIYNGYKASKK